MTEQQTAQRVIDEVTEAIDAPASTELATTATPVPQPAAPERAVRQVRLTLSRIDPWSAMKMSFLLSVALGIALVVAAAVLWSVMAGLGLFTAVDDIINKVASADNQSTFSLMNYVSFGRVVSLSVVVAVIDVILLTAIATLAAFLYNVSSTLVGGLQLTLTDD